MPKERRRASPRPDPAEPPFTHRVGPGCFGCDRANGAGLRLTFRPDPDGPPGSVRATTRPSARFLGPPGLIHGGVIAALLDEAMTKVTAHLGVFALTASLAVDFLRPLPVGTRVEVFGRPRSRRGRVLRHVAWVADARGRVIARGTTCFVVPRPELAAKIVRAMGRGGRAAR